MWPRDATAIGDERRFRLRALALAQHQALVGGSQVVAAEVGHRHGAARGVAGRGWVFTIGHAPKGFTGPLARFVGCQHPNPPQGELSRPAGRISVLDDPRPCARWLHAQREARQVVIAIERVASDRFQGVNETLGELGQGSLRKDWRCSPWPGHTGDTTGGKPGKLPMFSRECP